MEALGIQAVAEANRGLCWGGLTSSGSISMRSLLHKLREEKQDNSLRRRGTDASHASTGAEIQMDRMCYLSQNGYGLLRDLLQLHIFVLESKAVAARNATRFSRCFAIQCKHAAKRKVAAAEYSVCEDP